MDGEVEERLERMQADNLERERMHLEMVAEINSAYSAGMRRINTQYWVGVAFIWLVFFPGVTLGGYALLRWLAGLK